MNRTAYINGKIFTAERTSPWASALLIEDNKIIACGSDTDILELRKNTDETINLGQKFVMPGLIESHAHCVWGGTVILQLDLSTAHSRSDFIAKIAGYAKANKRNAILGGRWNEQSWPGKPLPSRSWIDEATGSTPLLLHRMDYHSALANGAALAIAGITKDTPDPLNGSIDRDENGNPTGILRDEAINLIVQKLPPATGTDIEEAMLAVFSEFRKFGITSVHDISLPEQIPVLQQLETEGRLPCRVFLRLPIETMNDYAQGKRTLPANTEKLGFGSFKIFADGALGSSTAYFFESYTDAPENFGLPMDILLHDKLKRVVEFAEKSGYQLSIHSIGDRASAEILTVMEEVLAGKPNRNRHRIEHVQHIRKSDLARFAKLGLVASVQPHHLFYDGAWLENRIGKARVPEAYSFKSMIDAGISTCFGSDFPIVPCNPFAAIKSAVTRIVDSAENAVIEPRECITLEQALYAYTIDAAYAEFSEQSKGSLAPGKFADFLILDRNPFETPAKELDTITVANTVFDGKIY